MEESLLLKLSALLTVSGLTSMVIIVNYVGPEKAWAADITPDDIGRGVKVCGEVKAKFTSKKGHTFFNLQDESGSIKIVVFNSTKTVPVDNGEIICIDGKIALYEGSLEITANWIGYA